MTTAFSIDAHRITLNFELYSVKRGQRDVPPYHCGSHTTVSRGRNACRLYITPTSTPYHTTGHPVTYENMSQARNRRVTTYTTPTTSCFETKAVGAGIVTLPSAVAQSTRRQRSGRCFFYAPGQVVRRQPRVPHVGTRTHE